MVERLGQPLQARYQVCFADLVHVVTYMRKCMCILHLHGYVCACARAMCLRVWIYRCVCVYMRNLHVRLQAEQTHGGDPVPTNDNQIVAFVNMKRATMCE